MKGTFKENDYIDMEMLRGARSDCHWAGPADLLLPCRLIDWA
jgi:hypothetical protein